MWSFCCEVVCGLHIFRDRLHLIYFITCLALSDGRSSLCVVPLDLLTYLENATCMDFPSLFPLFLRVHLLKEILFVFPLHFVSLWSRYTSEVHNLLMGQNKVGFNFLFFLILNTRSSLVGLVQTGSHGVLSLLTALNSGSYTVNLQHWHLTQWVFMVLGYVFQIPAGTENIKASSV